MRQGWRHVVYSPSIGKSVGSVVDWLFHLTQPRLCSRVAWAVCGEVNHVTQGITDCVGSLIKDKP